MKPISGQGLIELAIQHDYHEIIRVILKDLGDPFDTDSMLRYAIQNGSPKVIKMVLNYKKILDIDQEKTRKTKSLKLVSDTTIEIPSTHVLTDQNEEEKKKDSSKSGTEDDKITLKQDDDTKECNFSKITANDVEEALTTSRKSNGRVPLLRLLSSIDEEEPITDQDPIYKLLLDCELSAEDISSQCLKLQLIEPMLSWMGENLGSLSDGLLWTCEKGNVNLISHMLNNSTTLGVDTMVKNKNNETCFHIACAKGQKEIVELVLGDANYKEIDINATNSKENCGLSLAISNNHNEIVDLILNEYITKNISINTKDSQDINKYFLKACTKGNLDVVSMMLKGSDTIGLDLTTYGQRAFNLAKGNEEVTQILSQEYDRKGINFKKKTTQSSELSSGINVWHSTSLHHLCSYGFEDEIKILVNQKEKQNLDINVVDAYGQTPFQVACNYMRGSQTQTSIRIVEFLLDRKDIDANEIINPIDDETVFHIACSYGIESTVRLLLKNPQSSSILNATNKRGLTGFHLACLSMKYNVIKIILQSGEFKFNSSPLPTNWKQNGNKLKVPLNSCNSESKLEITNSSLGGPTITEKLTYFKFANEGKHWPIVKSTVNQKIDLELV